MCMGVSINQGWDERFKDNNKIMAVVKRIHDLSPHLYMQS